MYPFASSEGAEPKTTSAAATMNDPGLDQPVAQVADDQEVNPYEKEEKLEKKEEEDFLDPRYT